MKVLFVEAKRKIKGRIKNIELLPEKLHILYSIQYKELAQNIRKQLENKQKKILGFEQVLGCSKIKPKADLLLIGSGKFHTLPLLNLNKQIFIFDGKLRKLSAKDIQEFKKKQKAKLSKFFSSDNIGIIVSNKPGQSKIREIKNIKEKLEKKYTNKTFYLFITNTLNISELENFNIDFWLNTSCPGIELDSNKILNYEKVLNSKIKKIKS